MLPTSSLLTDSTKWCHTKTLGRGLGGVGCDEGTNFKVIINQTNMDQHFIKFFSCIIIRIFAMFDQKFSQKIATFGQAFDLYSSMWCKQHLYQRYAVYWSKLLWKCWCLLSKLWYLVHLQSCFCASSSQMCLSEWRRLDPTISLANMYINTPSTKSSFSSALKKLYFSNRVSTIYHCSNCNLYSNVQSVKYTPVYRVIQCASI